MIFWYVKVSCYLDCRWGKWPPRKQSRNPNSQLSCDILIRSNSTHRTWRSWSTHSQESCEWVDNIGEDIAEGWLFRFWPCSWLGHLNLPISISKLHTYDDWIINGLLISFLLWMCLPHGSSKGHEMLKRNDKCHSIADDVPIPKM